MNLPRIQAVSKVNTNQPPEKVLADLSNTLFQVQQLLMQVNNECVRLREELDQLKQSFSPANLA